MSKLAEGWQSCSLQEVLISLESGSRPRGGVRGIGGGVPSIGGEHLTYEGTFDLSSIKYVPEEFAARMTKGRIQTNDILVVKDGATTGKTSFVGSDFPYPDAVVNEHVFVCRPVSLVDPKFLFRYLTSRQGQEGILANFRGSAQGGINRSFADNTQVPLAPLNEQRRIVAKLENILAKVEDCQKRLAKIPVILKRFRQSVVAAACSGWLTADWRAEQNVAEDLEHTTIEEIAEYVGGFAYKSATFVETGRHQVVRIGNVKPLALNLAASPVFIPENIVAETQRFSLHPNDLVISMTGTKYKRDYGNTAVVTESDGSLYLNQRVARLRCREKVLPKFLLYWLQTDVFREFFFAGETGNVNQGNVGAEGIRKAPITLPSLAEQQEIVRRVEALFVLADQIEARYRKAQAEVDKLTQSILAKAFRGELVPTEAELARREGRVRTRLNSSGSSTQGTCPAGQTKARRVARGVKQ